MSWARPIPTSTNPTKPPQNYQQALEIRRRLGQKKGIADSLNMIAQTYDGLGKSDLALKNYNEALQIYREIGDKQDTGVVLNNLAQFYDDRGKYNDALKLFKESCKSSAKCTIRTMKPCV